MYALSLSRKFPKSAFACASPAGSMAVRLALVAAVAVIALSASRVHAQELACWGDNLYGQCTVPSGLGPVTAVAAGGAHTVAVKQDGTVACWGYNFYGQCTVPAGLGTVSAVAAGGFHTVALGAGGSVACWGLDHLGQSTVPTDLGPVTAVAAGRAHTVARKQDGTVACWGENLYGQCTVPAGLGSVTAVAAGGIHTVAVKQDGTVACWGDNSGGQCTVPAGLGSVTAVAAGGSHTVALKQDGTVACWGNNGNGQCTVPAGLGSVTAVAAGLNHTVAVKQDGTVACWGDNSGGQCTVPAGLGSVTAVTARGYFTIAIVSPPTASLSSSTSATCGLANGAIAVDVTGATSLAWSGPDGFTSTNEDLTGLAAGDYTLTASGPGGTATLTVTVGATADTTAPSITSYTPTATIAASQDCTAIVPDFVASVVATDDCTIASIAQSPLAGAIVGPGVYTIALTVTDTAGNATSVDALLTVTGSPANYYADADHDGFGTGSPITACAQPANSASVGGDQCDNDPLKQAPGICGCGTPDTDANGNGIADCADVFLVLTPSATSVSSGGTLTVRVSASASIIPMSGVQLTLHFDATRLRLDAVDPVAPAGLNLELSEQFDNTAGTLRYALGLSDPTVPLWGEADLCDLTFTVLPGADMCGAAGLVGFGNVGPFTTRFTAAATAAAVVPVLVDLPAVNLDTTAPVLAGMPSADISVPTDAGSTFGAHVALPAVTAADTCDGPVAVTTTGVPANGIFPIGATTVTWTATDAAGNTATSSRTVTVEPYQLLDAVVSFSSPQLGASRHALRIGAGAAIQVVDTLIPAWSGATPTSATVTVHVPVASSYPCVSVKSVGATVAGGAVRASHTLTDTASASVSGSRYRAEFVLLSGDSNDDDMVEILDYGNWLVDRSTPADTVRAPEARSNYNGDGLVIQGDVGLVVAYFFRVGESCTPGADAPRHPRDRIHVKELRRMGRGELAAADLNHDGWVDTRDMQMALQGGGGAQPRPEHDLRVEW